MTQPWTLDRPTTPRVRTWTPMVVTQLVVVLSVLAAGVTGAGVLRGRDNGGGKDVLSVVQLASSSALKAKTYRATFEFRFGGQGIDVKGTGEVLADLATKRQSGYFEFPSVGRINVVQVEDRGYFQIPNGATDAAGHHWLGVTVPAGEAEAAMGGQDPMAYLKLLADPKDVSVVGEETINGTRATHYTIKPDVQRLLDLGAKHSGITDLPAGAAEQLKNVHFDVWIDDDNLPRRIQITFKMQSAGSFGFTSNFLDYDGAVTVSEPASDDVTKLATLADLGPAFQQFMHP
jgi:hypothetical protein